VSSSVSTFPSRLRLLITIWPDRRHRLSRLEEAVAGKCRSTDGDRYAGAWEAGRRQGLGGCIFANGDRYQGQWSADLRHGKGACEYANGDAYQGEPGLHQSTPRPWPPPMR